MNTHADKKQENKNQSVAYGSSQMKKGSEPTFQFIDNRPRAVVQRKLQEMTNNFSSQQQIPIQKKGNNTGLPDNLKTGIENLSGISLDDVKVHRNSDKPAQLQADAYAQGTDIHLGPGQERHLPHEAWHVVQQKQGRVRSTLQMKTGIHVNDDAGLEKEADVMGVKALQNTSGPTIAKQMKAGTNIIQRKVGFEFETPITVVKPGEVQWDTDSKMARGNGWYLSPDEIGKVANEGKLEFKTYAIDTKNNGSATFNSLKTYCDQLLGKDKIPNAEEAFKNVTVEKSESITAKPQVTAGIKPDLLVKMLLHASIREESEENRPVLMEHADSRAVMKQALEVTKGIYIESDDDRLGDDYWGVVTLLAFYIRKFYKRAEYVETTDKKWAEHLKSWTTHTDSLISKEDTHSQKYFKELKKYADAMLITGPTFKIDKIEAKDKEWNDHVAKWKKWYLSLKDKKLEEELNEYLTRIESYTPALIKAIKKKQPSYAKGIASILPRQHMGTLAQIPDFDVFKNAVIKSSGKEGTDSLSPLGYKGVNGGYKQTIGSWLNGIESELKQQKNAGDNGMWSSKEILPAEDETVGEKSKVKPILFELRGMNGGLDYKEWGTWAANYLKYFELFNKSDEK